ncbi:MAG: gamma-glutamyltransferase family protein [Acidimicrobiales bacterium]
MSNQSVMAPNGMVSSIDHLASSAGVAILQAGGTAVDAAIATNAVLTVTSQHGCGMGGDLFALVHSADGPPAVLNASGRAGSGADPDRLRAEGLTAIPHRGHVCAAPVPGCVDGWLTLHERFGRLDLRDVLGPAILYAEAGFPAMPSLATAAQRLTPVEGHDFAGIEAGSIVHRPGVARALRAIVAEGRSGFYGGEFGDQLLELGDGEYVESDLSTSTAGWVSPLQIEVWGHDLWTVPPNSQGYLSLAGSAIAAQLDLPDDPRDPLWAHLMIEAARAAAFDRGAVLHEHADGDALLAHERLEPRWQAISADAAAAWGGSFGDGGTIHLTTVDREGMGVSLIQSNARDFGSHLVVGGTGIMLHNRGIGFNREAGHPAEYGPGRRPPHTLSPALITRSDGSLRHVVGTMGGDAQPHVVQQLVTRLLRHAQNPGEAVAAGRFVLSSTDDASMFDVWQNHGDVRVIIEPWMESAWRAGLEERGHEVAIGPEPGQFGHAHAIERRPDGVLLGRSDPRATASAAQGY